MAAYQITLATPGGNNHPVEVLIFCALFNAEVDFLSKTALKMLKNEHHHIPFQTSVETRQNASDSI